MNPFERVEEHLLRLYAPARTAPPRKLRRFGRLLARLKSKPLRSPILRPPASAAEIAAFEQRYSITLPNDVITCYQHMNGSDEYTDLNAGWLRFWPLNEWKPVADEFPTDPSVTEEPLVDAFVCADHGISAWFYAIDLDPRRVGRIYGLVPTGAVLVASSFSDFVDLALDDSDALFRT